MQSLIPIIYDVLPHHDPAIYLGEAFTRLGHQPLILAGSIDPHHFDPRKASIPAIVVDSISPITLGISSDLRRVFPMAFVVQRPDSEKEILALESMLSLWGGPTPSMLCQSAMLLCYESLSDASLSVTKICAELACSHDTLEREFHSSGYLPVWQWVLNRRMMEAKRLLLTTDLRVNEVAYAVGYNDLSSFTRTFTKTNGNPPSTFRKMNRHVR